MNAETNWQRVSGIVVRGHRVASRPSREYPYGTIEKQKPHFAARGLDLSRFYPGTLNISIAPLTFAMVRPKYTFPLVEWTDLHPPETFSFSPCRVCFEGREYEGLVYYPHPETKMRHFQNPSLVEVITEFISGVGYGSKLELALDRDEIAICLAR